MLSRDRLSALATHGARAGAGRRARRLEADQRVAFFLVLHEGEEGVARDLDARRERARIDVLGREILPAYEKLHARLLHLLEHREIGIHDAEFLPKGLGAQDSV